MACSVTWSVWKDISEELNETIAEEESLRSLYATWIRKRHSNKTRRKIWIATFYAILWRLWLHRNEISFKNCELDLQTVSHLIKWRVATWSKAWEEKVPYSAEMMAHNFQAIPMLFR